MRRPSRGRRGARRLRSGRAPLVGVSPDRGACTHSLAGIGYPLRLTWALFPAVLFFAALGWERLSGGSRAPALLLVGLNAAIGVGRTLLDPGTRNHAPSLMRNELSRP